MVGDRYLMTQENINDAVGSVDSKDFMSNAKFVYVFDKDGRAVDLYGYDEIFEKMKASMAGGQWERFSKSINVQSLKQHDIASMNNEKAFLYGTKWRVGTKYKQPIESSRDWPSEYEKSISASRIEECNMSKCLILESESILKKANFADQIDRVLGKGSAAKGYRIADITKEIEKVDVNTGISLSSKSETVIEIFSAEEESLFRYEISTQSELGVD